MAPVVEISQSLLLMARVSPPSPKVTAPPGFRANVPAVVNVVEPPVKATLVSAMVISSKVLAPVKV